MTFKAAACADAWEAARLGWPMRVVKADIRRQTTNAIQFVDHLATAIRSIDQIDDPNLLKAFEDVVIQAELQRVERRIKSKG